MQGRKVHQLSPHVAEAVTRKHQGPCTQIKTVVTAEWLAYMLMGYNVLGPYYLLGLTEDKSIKVEKDEIRLRKTRFCLFNIFNLF